VKGRQFVGKEREGSEGVVHEKKGRMMKKA